ncbi:MAG: POTRA domain-containing protein, partial [Terracidiphilus sp.]
MANYGPHQYVCSAQGSGPVKIMHISIFRALRTANRLACAVLVLALALSAVAALAQQPLTIESIRVIGNRRIPKETILARLFTHPGDTYDPVSIERDFNSLWNTSYFDDVRIEREDSEKGIILNVFVRERPTIREINYKGLNTVS